MAESETPVSGLGHPPAPEPPRVPFFLKCHLSAVLGTCPIPDFPAVLLPGRWGEVERKLSEASPALCFGP